ncbi:ABC transporter substrate-binding protein [Paenibacillus amylolyticus]|uniref:ABC transporter substrate-binding protein n=1 Tax=Paenibacillus amylolyticus TaxID=1451 RepID=UPI00201DD4FD|nr:ABC transporter substrate-binding protein [Paenibacillus amylolyticus]MCL6664478.1 ABC transporter substrate-binding protein [Paenibacillus amylolyticus]
MNNKGIYSLLPIMLISLLLIVSGCSTTNTSKNTPTTDSATNAQQTDMSATEPASDAKDKLSIMLDWYPNAVHSFIYVAQEKGYFANQGLDVEIQMPADTNDSLKLVAAGKIDLALSYQPQILLARGENIPVRSIAAVVRHPLVHLLTEANGNVSSPKDLEGKTVGYSSIPLYEAMVRTMISKDGGNPDNMNLVDVGFDLIPSLASGQADAIMGGFINHEQLILEKEGHAMKSINPVDYGVPDYYELVLTASEAGIEAKKDQLTRFVKAVQEGQKYVTEHPDEALNILLAHENETSPLDPEIETKSLAILLPLMNEDGQMFGRQEMASWENVRAWLVEQDLIPESVKAEDAFINLQGE